MKAYSFKQAVPVWEPGKDKEMNYNLVFRTVVPKNDSTIVAITASNMYQMFVNGRFAAEGPARAGHGYYRVDEIDVSSYLTKEENIIAVYVDSYYIKNFYLIKQSGFLCAEVIADGKVIAATGKAGFDAKYHSHRMRKVGRYSYQRTFSEVYVYDEATYKAFETDINCSFDPVCLAPVGDKKFIGREVPYPCYDYYSVKNIISRGEFTYLPEPPNPNTRRWISFAPDVVGNGYDRGEAEYIVGDEIDKCDCTATDTAVAPFSSTVIGGNQWAMFDIGAEKTGFVTLDITVTEKTEIILAYDEMLIDGDIDTLRFTLTGGIVLYLEPGTYNFVANEPASMKYIKIANKSEGAVTLSKLGIIEYAFDYKAKPLGSSNPKLNLIYDAAVETFRQNTLDIYMDCPSRERAGWLCDSYFTSKVEYHLTGKSAVEKNFLENFIMAEGFDDIPDYMFAMCYPSDFTARDYIPNWAMWYVIELGDYFERTGDRELVDFAKPKIDALIEHFESLKNSDGLIEKLPGWVFLEWSKANEFVQDVNYPTNMLYAMMLRVMGRLYDPKYIDRAREIEDKIREQAYFDGFFHDHAIRREDGTLDVVKDDVTETCQYYAFFTGIAMPETYPELWNILLNDFGPDREEKGLWSNIYPANAFIGNYLRFCILERMGEKDKIIENIEGYFLYMAEQTGTLWEVVTPTASCNHGFASIVALWLDKFVREQ